MEWDDEALHGLHDSSRIFRARWRNVMSIAGGKDGEG